MSSPARVTIERPSQSCIASYQVKRDETLVPAFGPDNATMWNEYCDKVDAVLYYSPGKIICMLILFTLPSGIALGMILAGIFGDNVDPMIRTIGWILMVADVPLLLAYAYFSERNALNNIDKAGKEYEEQANVSISIEKVWGCEASYILVIVDKQQGAVEP